MTEEGVWVHFCRDFDRAVGVPFQVSLAVALVEAWLGAVGLLLLLLLAQHLVARLLHQALDGLGHHAAHPVGVHRGEGGGRHGALGGGDHGRVAAHVPAVHARQHHGAVRLGAHQRAAGVHHAEVGVRLGGQRAHL